MTDNEIIKGLECHVKGFCKDCPFCGVGCTNSLFPKVLELINGLKADIKQLNSSVSSLEELCETKTALLTDANWSLITAKNQAIKEFAKRLENKLNCIPQHHFSLGQVLFDLDKTVKEIMG